MPYTSISALRTARNTKLSDSDFWILPDSPLTSSNEAVTSYRQGLRDLPASVKVDGSGNPQLNSDGNLQNNANVVIELPAELT